MFELWNVNINFAMEEEKETIIGEYNTYDEAIEVLKKIAKLTDDIGLSGCYIDTKNDTTIIDYGNNCNYFLIKDKTKNSKRVLK